jgi:hypothetical protein
MAYCGPKGIPLSTFLTWRDDDQEAALAWQAYENRRCGDCGTHPEDWDETQGGSRDAWRVQPTICEGCVALQQARDNDELRNRRGVHLHLTR